jgi:hypothetical protein
MTRTAFLALSERLRQFLPADKRLVTKLFITYFDSSSPSSKADVLKLISSILNLTSEEKAKIGLTPRPAKSWTNLLPIPIPFFGGSASQPTTTQGTPASEGDKVGYISFVLNFGPYLLFTSRSSPNSLQSLQSIADMWVEFLLREAENNASAGVGGAPPPSSSTPSSVTSASPSSSFSSLSTQQI